MCSHGSETFYFSFLPLVRGGGGGGNVKIALKWFQREYVDWINLSIGSTGRNVHMVRICRMLGFLSVCYWVCPSLLHSQRTLRHCPPAVHNKVSATESVPLCCTVSVSSISVLHIVLHHDFPMIHCTHTSLCMGRSALGRALNAMPCNTHLG
jgi:hypothetical protein